MCACKPHTHEQGCALTMLTPPTSYTIRGVPHLLYFLWSVLWLCFLCNPDNILQKKKKKKKTHVCERAGVWQCSHWNRCTCSVHQRLTVTVTCKLCRGQQAVLRCGVALRCSLEGLF